MFDRLTVSLLAVSSFLIYFYIQARRLRFHEHEGLPRPKPSLIWGHLAVINEYYKKTDPRRHIDYIFVAIAKALGSPQLIIMDLRPFTAPIVIVLSYDIAEQVTRASKSFPWSLPKSPTMLEMRDLVGHNSILAIGGEQWRHIRKKYNPGFAPQHLVKLLPSIVDKTSVFLERLDEFARSGAEFTLEALCCDLTFDIIGAVSLETDLRAQFPTKKQGDIVRDFREIMRTYTDSGGGYIWLNPTMIFRRRRLGRQVDKMIKEIILEKFAEYRANKKSSKNRSVFTLSLQDIESDVLPPSLLQETADTIKSFLFAGFDTTSSTLMWMFVELSRSPHVLTKLRAEHDEIFGVGADLEVVKHALLTRGEETMARMAYTSAVFKETLRLYPPGGTARRPPRGSGFFVKLKDGRDVCFDNLILYNCHYAIQRDPEVYGETSDHFLPERWLGNVSTWTGTDDDPNAGGRTEKAVNTHDSGKVPQGSWRPFETGPRNCIGQELANIEARVILALAIRRYDFTKVGLGELALDAESRPMLNEKGQYEVKEELFNTRQITSKPVDLCRMRVKFHES